MTTPEEYTEMFRQMNDVFARELLTAYHGPPPPAVTLQTPDADPEEHFEVEKIIRMKKMRTVFMALVQ
jgi:hypothetical protein